MNLSQHAHGLTAVPGKVKKKGALLRLRKDACHTFTTIKICSGIAKMVLLQTCTVTILNVLVITHLWLVLRIDLAANMQQLGCQQMIRTKICFVCTPHTTQ